MNPNHYLAVAIWYLFQNRPQWPKGAAVGKTLVSSAIIDRVARHLGLVLKEVPVGFKWFVPGLGDGSLGFGGEESAGASFLRRDGTTWTTDKDGLLLGLLAAEITARVGKDPSQIYAELTQQFGAPSYERIDAPATAAQKKVLGALKPELVTATSLAGDPITAKLTHAPGNGASIGGLKVTTDSGWFAARPSGTEDVYKIYAESFRGPEHLARLQDEARLIVSAAFSAAGVWASRCSPPSHVRSGEGSRLPTAWPTPSPTHARAASQSSTASGTGGSGATRPGPRAPRCPNWSTGRFAPSRRCASSASTRTSSKTWWRP